MHSFAGLGSLDRSLTSLHHAFVKARRKKVSPVVGVGLGKLPGCWSKSTKRVARRSWALPDHFSQAESKVSLNTAASNMDVLEVSVAPESQQSHDNEKHRDQKNQDRMWNEWLDYFAEVERAESEIDTLASELQEHVAIEHYEDATRTNQRIDEIGSQDILTTVHNKLQHAIQEQKFDQAARLRDEGLVGLCGWWVARGRNDPQGKLVYIHRSFCRYSGRLFTPKELASLCGIVDPFGLEPIIINRDDAPDPVGNFALEVFLKSDEDGSLQHQACVLRTPILQEPGNDSTIDILPQKPEFAIHTEADDSGKAVRLTLTIIQKDEEENMPVSLKEKEADAEVSAIIVSANESDDSDESTENVEEQNDSFTPMELQYRTPAIIRWWDRNRFVLSVDEDLAQSDDHSSDSEEDKPKEYEVLSGPAGSALDKIPSGKLLPLVRGVRHVMEMISKSPKLLQQQRLKLPVSDNLVEMSREFVAEYAAYLKKEIFGLLQENNNLEGEVMFTRLPLDDNTTDTFTGFFMGSFGPHGPELLHLSRQTDKVTGKEFLQARKITGDKHVPAGEVSFQASIDRHNRMVPDGISIEDLGIRASYTGKGRIGEEGSTDLKWVKGELLVFDPANPITNGADLGLVWHIPHKRKAYVMLHRVQLPESEESQ